MMRALAASAIIALVVGSPARAADNIEAPSLVPAFTQTCLMPGVSHEDRIAAVEQSGRWTKQATVTFDIAGLQPSNAIGAKPNFTKFTDAAQWNGDIDEHQASILLISFGPKSRYQHACVMMIAGLDNAMPYGGDLKAAFKAFGAGGKSVDLVHYYEFAGTLKSGVQPVEADHKVHGEIFSRSRAGSIKETTHIYLAY